MQNPDVRHLLPVCYVYMRRSEGTVLAMGVLLSLCFECFGLVPLCFDFVGLVRLCFEFFGLVGML
jgi:hypothetical protein